VAPKTGLAAHFEGWEAGLLAIFLAGSSALVAVPRAVDPMDLPDPRAKPAALVAVARADDALAARAEADAARGAGLDFDVRELGSAIRAYGIADADGADDRVMAARRAVAEAAGRARTRGDEEMLRLRAFQLREFLRELRAWESTGKESRDLVELGGAFVRMATRNGWLSRRGLAVDDAVRRALFKKRWNELALVHGPRFDLALDEQRALYGHLLSHPPRDEVEAAPGPRMPRRASKDERAAFATEQYRLRKLEELAKLDPSYPADLARGVVTYRMRRYNLASDFFIKHLDAHPDGPMTLRARNYLRAALGHTLDQEL
jgi:hypothetical protein